MQWLTSAGGVASAITAILAVITAVLIKPIRGYLAKRKKRRQDEEAFRVQMLSSMTALNVRIDAIETNLDTNEKDRIRNTVLNFAEECRRGERHTVESYRYIIGQNDKYRELLAKTNDTNGVYTTEYAYILRCYESAQENNDFLI